MKSLLGGTGVTTEGGQIFDELLEATLAEIADQQYIWDLDVSKTEVYKKGISKLSPAEKLGFIVYHGKKVYDYFKAGRATSTHDPVYRAACIRNAIIQQLFLSKPDFNEEEWTQLLEATVAYNSNHLFVYNWAWPVKNLLTQLQKKYNGGVLPDALFDALNRLAEAVKTDSNSYYEKERVKINEAIETLTFSSVHGAEVIKPVYFHGKDDFSKFANTLIKTYDQAEKECWYQLTALSLKASGSKPNGKFLKDSKAIIDELGEEKFKAGLTTFFQFIIQLKEEEHTHTYQYEDQSYTYRSYDFLSAPTIESLKGFVWMCKHIESAEVLQTLASLSERCFRKIPGKGPAAQAVGNACLFTLSCSEGLSGVSHLSRLKLRIKQTSTQSLIEKYLNQAAQQRGVSVTEVEDLAVDDFGLLNGEKIVEAEGFKASLRIEKVGKVSLTWYKSDGSIQKTVPSVIKEKHPDLLKTIKSTGKQIEVTLSTQRDRIDRAFRLERLLTKEYFETYYLHHGLMSYLSKQLIWILTAENFSVEVLFDQNGPTNNKGEQVKFPSDYKVQLWHPATSTTENVREWRSYLIGRQLQQPIKQAFREIYLLTDAEINTRTYSNRMASHILKQHQFNSLAKIRGWKYSLLGAYDDGRFNEGAELSLPEYNLRAEFWVNEVNADDEWNDTGIWNYVSTDQVRFVSMENGEPIELIHVPVKAFSEVMRDLDLFVGVASVGNDPNWRDSGGIPAYRDYWESYAFGELTEVARGRREILERLIPRLKIAKVSTLTERFLVVQGKKRTYKIHLGSTNILMEPNDQYLCIVPDRSSKSLTDNVFLPFEGDTGLSVIISKAFLLAEDDKITDPTITSQIG